MAKEGGENGCVEGGSSTPAAAGAGAGCSGATGTGAAGAGAAKTGAAGDAGVEGRRATSGAVTAVFRLGAAPAAELAAAAAGAAGAVGCCCFGLDTSAPPPPLPLLLPPPPLAGIKARGMRGTACAASCCPAWKSTLRAASMLPTLQCRCASFLAQRLQCAEMWAEGGMEAPRSRTFSRALMAVRNCPLTS